MNTFANSDDPNENAAFHQGLHCLLRQMDHKRKYSIVVEIITWDPSIYTMYLTV